MPIGREEFESGRIDREGRILALLSDQRNRAYSQEDLLRALNYQVPVQGTAPREFVAALGGYVSTTEEQFTESIGYLLDQLLVRSKEIEGNIYYIAALRPPA